PAQHLPQCEQGCAAFFAFKISRQWLPELVPYAYNRRTPMELPKKESQ
ncbi:MAG: hypothetical protein QG660_1695, partial [Pseudomonadota bacterium]|nr:hypothetical protein [Pseudomonadota bacterium]